MKKIIPIITLIGLGAALTGCNSVATIGTNDMEKTLSEIQEKSNHNNLTEQLVNLSTKFKNYNITIDDTLDTNIPNTPESSDSTISIDGVVNDAETSHTNTDHDIINETRETVDSNIKNDDIDTPGNQLTTDATQESNNEQALSTLYSLSQDVSESCNDFCELKEEVAEAIQETKNLMKKIQNKEIELNDDQKLKISQQAMELKELARQLNRSTSALALQLNDIYSNFDTANNDVDSMTWKYFLILDSLANSNQMLAQSLSAVYNINGTMNRSLPFNQGRISYGYQKNNEPPVIKDYIIEDGKMIENTANNEASINANESNNNNLDTYNLKSTPNNLDSYGNEYSNIDTFFNTALLDNELYGNTGMYGYNNLYNRQNKINNINGTNNNTNSTTKDNNTPNMPQTSKQGTKKKFNIKSNIDTYRDQDTPTLSAKVNNLKQSINSFFGKIKSRKNNAENPIHKLTEKYGHD